MRNIIREIREFLATVVTYTIGSGNTEQRENQKDKQSFRNVPKSKQVHTGSGTSHSCCTPSTSQLKHASSRQKGESLDIHCDEDTELSALNGDHAHTEHSCHSMGSAQHYLRKFFKVGGLVLGLFFFTTDRLVDLLPHFMQQVLDLIVLGDIALGDIVVLVFIGLIFREATVFIEHAKHELKMGKPGMMTLVSIAVVSGFLFSVLHYLLPSTFDANFTLEIATLVWVLMLGHYIEAKASINSRIALQELLKLLPKKAHKVVDMNNDAIEDVDVSDLKVGDIILVRAGENIPADGVVINGGASVSNAHVTGESLPITKDVNDTVVAGASVLEGMLYIRVSAVGKDSTVGRLASLLEEALATTPSMQRLADKVAFYLTFVSLSVAILTFVVWYLVLGKSIALALTMSISVLVITCPHALGLAIPAVIAIAVDKGARLGVFIKDLTVLEKLPKVKWVVLDKTGTITSGKLIVDKMQIFTNEIPKPVILGIVHELERSNVHPIAEALLDYVGAQKANVRIDNKSIELVPGRGISAEIESPQLGRVYLGSVNWAKLILNKDKSFKEILNNLKVSPNQSVVLLFTQREVLAAFLLSDSIRKTIYKTVDKLHAMGINVAMLTGDNRRAAEYVASKLGIDMARSEVSPEDKYKFIKTLQEQAAPDLVMMVGDGINDSAALVQADVGVAVRSGTDIAVNSADIVLMNNDPYSIVRLLKLGRLAHKKMLQNIFWALGYNVFAIPAAAGVLMPLGVSIRPELAALIMSLSTVIVVVNALLMRKSKI